MTDSVSDESSTAVGGASARAPRRPGRPRIHEDDAARKRAYNQRRAQAYGKLRAAERRAGRWQAEAKQLRRYLEAATRRSRDEEVRRAEQEKRLVAKIARLEDELDRVKARKDWAVQRARAAMAEAEELRDRVARAERAVHRTPLNCWPTQPVRR